MTYQLPADVIADTPAFAALGFNGVMPYDNGTLDVSSTLGLLDAFQQYGLKGYVDLRSFVQYGTYSGSALTARVNALKNHPALAGWYVYDEPTTSVPAGQLEAGYAAIKAADSVHPVYGVYPGFGANFWPPGDPRVSYPLTTDMQDVFSVDSYPLFLYPGQAFDEDQYRGWLADALGATPAGITQRALTMQAFSVPDRPAPTAANLLRFAEIAEEESWTGRGVWMWLWHWGSTLSPEPFTYLKAMVAADPATATAVKTINLRQRAAEATEESTMTLTKRTSAAQAITLASLATSSDRTVGRCSAAYDNTTLLDELLAVSGVITTGTGPTAGRIEVWAFAERADGVWPEIFTTAYTGADGAFTVKSRAILAAGAALVRSMATDSASDRSYPFKRTDLVQLLGGAISKVAFFVTHGTSTALNATAANHDLSVKTHYWP